jgi:hypothetical protein
VRGDHVFGEHNRVTTAVFEDFFPNDDYFPDINNLFGYMADDGNPNAKANEPVPL